MFIYRTPCLGHSANQIRRTFEFIKEIHPQPSGTLFVVFSGIFQFFSRIDQQTIPHHGQSLDLRPETNSLPSTDSISPLL